MSAPAFATKQRPPSVTPVAHGILQRCADHTCPASGCAKDDELVLQRQRAWGSEPDTVPPIVDEVLRSSSQPLDPGTHVFFERRFGHDFSDVRVHSDAKAAESAQAVDALAYTIGRDIVFAASRYSPRTSAGRKLLAHELTHVIQQRGDRSTAARLEVGAPSTLQEHEAESVATSFKTVSRVTVSARAPTGSVQRAAPAVGIGALLYACALGAVTGVLLDLGFQAGLHWWRGKTEKMKVDICSLVLSGILGCVGGAAAKKWLEPWVTAQLGPKLGAVGGTLIGKVLLWIANRGPVGIPRWIVKTLLKYGCISHAQAEALAPGVAGEEVAAMEVEEGGTEVETA